MTGNPPRWAAAFPGQATDQDATVAALDRYAGDPLVAAFRATLDGPPDLGDTRVSQPAAYVTGLAAARDGDSTPELVLGHSLGELTALAYAGAVDEWAGLALATRRGEVCHREQVRRPGAMLALMGVDATGVEWVRRTTVGRSGGVLEVAGLNGTRQTVLSGDVAAVEAALPVIAGIGALGQRLGIGGAFHSPLMIDAVPDWQAAVSAVEVLAPRLPVLSTVDAAVHDDPDELRELLVRALLLPVRWVDAVRALRAAGVGRVWDAGPGRTLHKLGRRESIVDFGARPEPAVAP